MYSDIKTDFKAVIIGATFAGAGIAEIYGSDCLIVEKRPQAGYEFLSALKFGSRYEKKLQTVQANALYRAFEKKGAFEEGNVCLFDCAADFYALLENKNILLNTDIYDIKYDGNKFIITLFNIEGFKTVTAKEITDTTVRDSAVESCCFNALVSGDFKRFPTDVSVQKTRFGDAIISIPMKTYDYTVAREQLSSLLRQTGCRLVYAADYFDYTLKKTVDDGFLPSCGFENPLAAYDGGILYANGGAR